MAVDQQLPMPARRDEADTSQNWFGIVALVTGIVGISIAALVLGILGLRAVRGGRATNRGMALAGVILGAIGIVVGIVAAAVLVVAALTVTNAASDLTNDAVDTSTPAPSVDPADATRFVLKPDAGSDPALLEAASVYLASRVDAEVQVGADRSTIVVDFGSTPAGPGVVDELTRPSNLQLRPVIVVAGPEPSSNDWPATTAGAPSWAGDADFFASGSLGSAFDETDCATPAAGKTVAADHGAVACQNDGSAKYLLGAAVVSGDDLSAVDVDGPTVTMKLDDHGAQALGEITTRLSALSAPNNQFAIVSDGLVVSAPSVAEPITAGVATSQLADEHGAQLYAGALTYGTPLMTLSVQRAER